MLAGAAMAVAIVASVQAADVSGKWTAQVPGRDGQTREQTFTFKQDGEKLTGSVTAMQGDVEIKDGTITGDDIAFNVVVSMQGNEMKMVYKGKISGSEIKFTRTREGSDRSQEFTAKKATT
jgi:opacity protein-like surface antigen